MRLIESTEYFTEQWLIAKGVIGPEPTSFVVLDLARELSAEHEQPPGTAHLEENAQRRLERNEMAIEKIMGKRRSQLREQLKSAASAAERAAIYADSGVHVKVRIGAKTHMVPAKNMTRDHWERHFATRARGMAEVRRAFVADFEAAAIACPELGAAHPTAAAFYKAHTGKDL